ncbi:MAG: NAD(P)-dependent alcohol dehydrogenase [Acidimicrobiia bacterium]|nr:NAD(P)-dependent alcohol dehydrogenase [Acidimicrobiia bacterium]
MKAIYHDQFGPPDVLELRDLDPPTAGPGEVLVEVHAAGVNPGDRHAIRGVPYAARLIGYGLTKPKQRVPGIDLAGRIAAVGQGVTRFELGDEVFGWATGTFAQYATASQHSLEPKPGRLTFEQAAAVPTAGFAALQALRNVGQTEAGHHVLVIGASGGVGTFAVQIAKAFGAEVTGVAGTRNIELVRSAGADRVIDYSVEDFTRSDDRYDQVIDLVGHARLSVASRVLTTGGTYVVVGGQNPDSITGMGRFATAVVLSPILRRRIRPLFSKPSHDDLSALARLLESGKVLPVIDATYDLNGVVDALRYVEAGHTRGKVVLTI